MTIDLQAMMNQAMVNMHEEGKIQKMISDQLEKTTKSVLDDALGSYSDFGKQLKETIKKTLAFNIDRLELPTYNVMIMNVVKDRLDQIVHAEGIEKMKEHIDRIFAPVEPEMKLSKIIEEWMSELNSDHEYDGKEITLIHDPSNYGGCWLHIDKEEDREKYRCEIYLGVDKEGKIYALKCDDKDVLKLKTTYSMNALAEQFFRIYAAGSKLIVDIDDVEPDFGYDD